MNIEFLDPTEKDIIQSYEAFRLSNEPDSPQTPYQELTADRKNYFDNMARNTFKIISIENKKIGYLSFMPRDNKINLGACIYEEFRGKGYISLIYEKAVQFANEHFKGQVITAATRKDNISAIKCMEKAGFKLVEEKILPPIGSFKEPITYVRYEKI